MGETITPSKIWLMSGIAGLSFPLFHVIWFKNATALTLILLWVFGTVFVAAGRLTYEATRRHRPLAEGLRARPVARLPERRSPWPPLSFWRVGGPTLMFGFPLLFQLGAVKRRSPGG